MSTIKELREERTAAFAALNKLLADYKPAEKKLRDNIKEIQEKLTVMEMKPQLAILEAKISAGEAKKHEVEKFSTWSGHVAALAAKHKIK